MRCIVLWQTSKYWIIKDFFWLFPRVFTFVSSKLHFIDCHKSPFSDVYTALSDLNIEWIAIKGISDFADGRNVESSSWRSFASLMAASLTAHILSNAIVFQHWPHYKSTSKSWTFRKLLLLFFFFFLTKPYVTYKTILIYNVRYLHY